MSVLMSLTQTRGDTEAERMDGGKNKTGQTLEWNEMNIHRCVRHSSVLDRNFSKCLNKDYIVPELFTVYLSPQDVCSSNDHETVIPPPISIENLYWTCSLRVHRPQTLLKLLLPIACFLEYILQKINFETSPTKNEEG